MFPVIELEGFPKISSNRAFGVDVEDNGQGNQERTG